jgi:hypothetical protein
LRLEQAHEQQNWSEVEKLYTSLGLAFARVREFMKGGSSSQGLGKAS